jgi:CopG family transcriptional regulator / antitoxin EndoAI
MTKRINVILPAETLRVLDRVAPKGNRSRLIDQAVLFYVKTKTRENLRQRLKEGYLASAKENLKLAEEWFPLEEEAWQIAKTKT